MRTMKDTPHQSADGNDADHPVRVALARMFASPGFARAPRMQELLHFLVEKHLTGAVRETSEYAIGIEVFQRDATAYSTCDDPIVRVQIGRLREKLRHYYATAGAQATLRFAIPVGSYMPTISTVQPHRTGGANNHLMAVTPLAFFTGDSASIAFARGLNEELAYQLFRAFGQTIVSHTFNAMPHAASISHRLEGSIRIGAGMIRASLRLVDTVAGCIAWSCQFDRTSSFDIALQEELAGAICAALAVYFDRGE
jgi:TolB-like protein